MSKTRKTVDVKTVLERGNFFLAALGDDKENRDRRYAVASFMESLLSDAGAYAGFQYLNSAGLVRNSAGAVESVADDSRRRYNTHGALL